MRRSGTGTLTIHALGDQVVVNNAYSGPSATTAPFNQKTITRHTASALRREPWLVGLGWHVPVDQRQLERHDDQWSQRPPARPPADTATVAIWRLLARCGQLVITAANGKQSVDTVTVTIGGKAPTQVHVTGTSGCDRRRRSGRHDHRRHPAATTRSCSCGNRSASGCRAAPSILNAVSTPRGEDRFWRPAGQLSIWPGIDGQPYTSGDRRRLLYDRTRHTVARRFQLRTTSGGPASTADGSIAPGGVQSAGMPRLTATWPKCCRSRP